MHDTYRLRHRGVAPRTGGRGRTVARLVGWLGVLLAVCVSAESAEPTSRWGTVREVLGRLHDSDPSVVRAAESRLREMGLSDGTIALGKQIADPVATRRAELASSLGRMDAARRAAVVRAFVADPEPRVRIALVEAARGVDLGQSERAALRRVAASDEDTRVRGYAKLLVAEWPDEGASVVQAGGVPPTTPNPIRQVLATSPPAFVPPGALPPRRSALNTVGAKANDEAAVALAEEQRLAELVDEFNGLLKDRRYADARRHAADARATFTPRSVKIREFAASTFAETTVEQRIESAQVIDRRRAGFVPGLSVKRRLRPYWGGDDAIAEQAERDIRYGGPNPDLRQAGFDDDRVPDVLNRPLGDEPGGSFLEDPKPPNFTDEMVIVAENAPQGYTGKSGVLRTEFQDSPHFVPVEDRWRLGFEPWDRYGKKHPSVDDYPGVEGHWWDPYNLNVLKGDYPIIGQHTFFRTTATSFTTAEWREVPTATTPFESTKNANQEPFFGDSAQSFINQNFIVQMDLFHGNAAFKPIDWQVRVTPVLNFNYLDVNELGVVGPDVRSGTRRSRDHLTLQEYFVEAKLADLGPDYDFVSVRAGNQLFNSDFRGHIFFDTNRGIRLFGTRLGNRDQFNLAFFDMVEKETNSELNTFEDRHQNVLVANYFRQDFIFPGYTAQASLHYNRDDASFQLDRNDFLVRPDPAGVAQPHRVDVVYLGFAGEGHIERFNVSHVMYWAVGNDSLNPIAGRDQRIDAYMGAIELSYDRDWVRFRSSLFFQSGDDDINDHKAEGFDTILDDPNFAGGNFSYWQRNAVKLFGVNVTQRRSLVADLRSSKIQGQANFVNPGLAIVNAGMDFEITPKLKVITNVNYLWFDSTETLEVFTFQDRIDPDIGIDYSLGVEYRPLLNDNVIMLFGFSSLVPASGIDDIFGDISPFNTANAGNAEASPLYASFFELVMTY